MTRHPLAALACVASLAWLSVRAADPLPSWNETAPKQALLAFVEKTTRPGSPDFIPEPQRIAVFDNDGTLWAERPLYVQVRFALDRVRALAPQHPEWRRKQPFRKLLTTSSAALVEVTEAELLEVLMAAHAGMTSEEFERIVADWISTARHPQTGRLYTEMVYQPMLELMAFLRAHGFKTFIASGGGIEFMRVFSERVYGIPPEQVIGSIGQVKYEVRDGKPVLVRLPQIRFVGDKDGKPVGIQTHIGRRPVMAFGNSDGDLQMIEWTTSGPGARLGLIVHHDDDAREWAYDRQAPVGRLDRVLDEAPTRGWTVTSMKSDWKRVYPDLEK